jgi:hypothetical protein
MERMSKAIPGRAWRKLDAALFSGAFVLYVSTMPLGLDRVESAPRIAAGLVLDTQGGSPPLALLAMRVGEFLPLGDVGLRANLVSALLTALAVTLIGRLCVATVGVLRPPARARQEARDFVHEPIAALGSAGIAALSVATFDIGTRAGTAAATLALIVAGLWAGFELLHRSHSAAAGLALSGLAGLSAGVDAIATPLLWPAWVVLGVWALRKGARWPLLAPLAFVAGWGGAALAGVALASSPASYAAVVPGVGALRGLSSAGLGTSALELADQIGVVGALVAGIGVVVLSTRATLLTAWLSSTAFTAVLFFHAAQRSSAPGGVDVAEAARAALPAAIAVSCTFASVGLVHVAGRLGRARMAGVLALAVIMVSSPAMDSRPDMDSARNGLPMHLLDRALDRAEIRATVDPGSVPVSGLFRLARALGLRPDLDVQVAKAHRSAVDPR